MAFSPQIAPLERFALRDGSKPLTLENPLNANILSLSHKGRGGDD